MSEDNYIEHEGIVTIDELKLDQECIRQPRLYLQQAHKAAGIRSRMDRAKAELDVTESQCSKAIRQNPEKHGMEKPTEAGIKAAIQIHPDYTKALTKLNRLRHELELAQAVLTALEHKKRSLSLLVELHGMGYFSEPRVSADGKRAVDALTKKRAGKPLDSPRGRSREE